MIIGTVPLVVLSANLSSLVCISLLSSLVAMSRLSEAYHRSPLQDWSHSFTYEYLDMRIHHMVSCAYLPGKGPPWRAALLDQMIHATVWYSAEKCEGSWAVRKHGIGWSLTGCGCGFVIASLIYLLNCVRYWATIPFVIAMVFAGWDFHGSKLCGLCRVNHVDVRVKAQSGCYI